MNRALKVGLAGSHSTGKTTTMNAVAARLREVGVPVATVTEAARECPHPINEAGGWRTQSWIQATHLYKEAMAVRGAGVVLTDRTSLDHLAYAKYQFDRGRIAPEDFADYKKVALAWLGTYDVLCYVPIEFPLVADGVRSEDVAFQKDIDDLIGGLMREEGIEAYPIMGSVEARAQGIFDILSGGGEDENLLAAFGVPAWKPRMWA